MSNIKITIDLGDKEFTLTTEQAKELRNILNNLLGPNPVYHYPYMWYSGYWEVKPDNTYTNGNVSEYTTYSISLK